ncbi:hypothetical protein ACEN9X_19485 [Mucilaginibacter sp. Mucisp86]|uniref:hypothetical protein n=1 Tax=Mucilaginibacter sp. Mucisp86 TaxID=3243060 RepID=UPI0039B6D6F3
MSNSMISFFSIAEKLGDLKQQFIDFRRDAGDSLHIERVFLSTRAAILPEYWKNSITRY